MEKLAPTVYPSMIARACSALDESPLFRDMPDGYLRVMRQRAAGSRAPRRSPLPYTD